MNNTQPLHSHNNTYENIGYYSALQSSNRDLNASRSAIPSVSSSSNMHLVTSTAATKKIAEASKNSLKCSNLSENITRSIGEKAHAQMRIVRKMFNHECDNNGLKLLMKISVLRHKITEQMKVKVYFSRGGKRNNTLSKRTIYKSLSEPKKQAFLRAYSNTNKEMEKFREYLASKFNIEPPPIDLGRSSAKKSPSIALENVLPLSQTLPAPGISTSNPPVSSSSSNQEECSNDWDLVSRQIDSRIGINSHISKTELEDLKSKNTSNKKILFRLDARTRTISFQVCGESKLDENQLNETARKICESLQKKLVDGVFNQLIEDKFKKCKEKSQNKKSSNQGVLPLFQMPAGSDVNTPNLSVSSSSSDQGVLSLAQMPEDRDITTFSPLDLDEIGSSFLPSKAFDSDLQEPIFDLPQMEEDALFSNFSN